MADLSSSPNKTHIPSSSPKGKSIFKSYFFTKSVMIILVLLVFSYFPSQVPEFFKETAIINKLWGLIYLLVTGIAVSYGLFSRKTDIVLPSDDNIGDNETYLSGISQISSIFEDGYHGIRNSYEFEEKSWVEKFKGSEIGEGQKRNKYFLGESLVVINDEKFVLEQLGRQKNQNLGSKSLDSADVGKSVVGDSDSDSGSRNRFKESKKGKFRGLMPVKLEEKFKESGNDDSGSDSDSDSDSRTRFNRRSKSMRLEKHDDMFTGENGILDFDDVKSQSVRFGMPSKIKNLSKKEESNVVEVNHRYKKLYLNGEKSFMESKLQESSTEGLKDFSGTLDESSEEIVKDFGKIKVDDDAFDSKSNKQFVRSKSQSSSIGASSETLKNMLRKEEKADVLHSLPKPITNANTSYKRGKSVRTNRLKEQVLEPKVDMFQSQTDVGKVETHSKHAIDEMNANDDELSDTEPHFGEVDRKAEEFIAKFKEQIRLQKVASARKLNLL